GAKGVDAVAELARAARHVAHVRDAIVEHHGAVLARNAAYDLDPVVAGRSHAVARDRQSARVERQDRDVGRIHDRAAEYLARDALEIDAVAARRIDLAILDARAAA